MKRSRPMVAGASTLLLDERFEQADERFLDELLRCEADRKLHALAARWFDDPRPWAREMLLRYVADGCDRSGHRGLVKQLFRLAESRGDDLLMAHFLVAFDRMVEHTIRTTKRWDLNTREAYTEYRKVRVPGVPRRQPRKGKQARFSLYTRQYLQRRALRYFRRLGYRDRDRFGRAARTALLLYEDQHVQRPEQLLDAWGLVHLLYHGSDAVVRHPRGIRVAEGHMLSDLEPAPLHPDAWLGYFDELAAMLAATRAVVVRRWLVAWLRGRYEADLRSPDIRKIERLLASPYPDVQTFAAGLLGQARGVETLPVSRWLSLLSIDNPAAIPILCDLVARTVSPDRLSLDDCVQLACARPAPVASLGLSWARTKPVDDRDALQVVLRLLEAQAVNVVDDAAAWIVELVARPSLGVASHVLELLDARKAGFRAAGMALMQQQTRFGQDVSLWAALAESPYADVRGFLIAHLEARLTDLPAPGVHRIWATTLLGVSRGSRTKRLVLRQLADEIARTPDRASELLPLMAVALRSVREPERRAALAAIAKAAFAQPALRAPVARHLPELVLFPEGST